MEEKMAAVMAREESSSNEEEKDGIIETTESFMKLSKSLK